MKKCIYLLLCVAMLAAVLSGCECNHEWQPADCDTPKTCSLCGETRGEPNAHKWQDATCDKAKTCENCGKLDGSPLAHNWVEASCEAPKTCSLCQKTEGSALTHQWQDATTEAPKTCSLCQKTEGTKIETDPRFHTAACSPLFGTWEGEIDVDLAEQLDMEFPGQDMTVTAYITFTFGNDGSFRMQMEYDPDAYMRVTKIFTIELMYSSLMESGLTRDQADALFATQYGCTIEQYVDQQLATINPEDFNTDSEMVYYVSGDQLYAADSWEDELEPETFRIDGNKLTITEDELSVELTKKS